MVVDPSKLHDFDDAMITNLKIIIKTGLTDINEKMLTDCKKITTITKNTELLQKQMITLRM